MTQPSNVTMQPKPNTVERPMTLIEKLEQARDNHNYYLETCGNDRDKDYHSFGKKCYQEAINIVKRHSDWISVDERLPEDDENVLVYSGDKEMFIAWCGVLGRTWRDSFRDAPYDELVGISITHWMPLPQPPSELQSD